MLRCVRHKFRVLLGSATWLVIIIFIANYSFTDNQELVNPEIKKQWQHRREKLPLNKDKKRTVVILVANQRTGSTFLGEIFGKNPSVFYLFEPLLPYSKHCDILQRERINLLSDLLQCRFENIKNAYKQAFNISRFRDDSAECLKHNLCFNTNHKPLLKKYIAECERLSDPSAQVEYLEDNEFQVESLDCGYPLKPSILSRICKKSDFIVHKVLRLCSFETLQNLYNRLTREAYKVYILHLVRDPRAVIASRLSLHVDGIQMQDVPHEVNLLCGKYKLDMNYVEGATNGKNNMISDGNYMRIRHEDFTINATTATQQIYKFLQKKIPDEVSKFLADSHKAKSFVMEGIQEEDDRALREEGQTKQYTKNKEILRLMNDPFATIRDPSEVLEKWRTTVSYSLVRLVQKKCGEVMVKLGYRIFKTNNELRDTTQIYY